MSPRKTAALTADQLRQKCDPRLLSDGAKPIMKDGLVGQERGLDALRFAVNMRHDDFNLFVLGAQGTGRRTAVETVLRTHGKTRGTLSDWIYVNNFETPHKPVALALSAGQAASFRAEMENLVDDLAKDVPALFESDEYQTQRRAIDEEYSERHEQAMADFGDRARAEDIALIRTPMGFMVAAIRDGEVLKTEGFNKLPEEEQAAIEKRISRFQEELGAILRDTPKLEREHRIRVEALNAEMAERAVASRIDQAEAIFSDSPAVRTYLAHVRKDMIENPDLFLHAAAQQKGGPFPEAVGKSHLNPVFRRYMINVLISLDPDAQKAPPVVIEDLPSFDRLAGQIEHVSQMGSLVTDFTLIRPGALHRANGGYLVIDARRILGEPYAWDTLKRSLKKRSVSITSLAERMSLFSTTSLEPEPIPLDVRVILIGDRFLYALLVVLDPEFSELFKVQADFADSVERSDETLAGLASILRSYAARKTLLPPEDAALARLLDEATRLVEDAKKLTLKLAPLTDILREAEHYTREAGATSIRAEDIDRAVTARDHRASRVRERVIEAMSRGTILIETDGARIGQINGLSVLDQGDYRFGKPSRITASVRMGSGKLIDIEREVELGGAIHSKGVLILAGYLAATYALNVPFSLHASLVFEQSYGGVDGDSASCTELVALLSALSGQPIRQDRAITGSVNQIGEVQAIGGVNEKIEGFFDICAARGLTGNQGVIIPAANVQHLMLRDRVVKAVSEGRFEIIPVTTVDDALELLTGLPAGCRDTDGAFPPGSVNALVEDMLLDFARSRKAFGARSGQTSSGDHT